MKKSNLILGVLGGMGPAAAAEFLRLLAERAPAARDQDHPVTYLLSDPTTPDRSSAILGRGEDPTDRLKKNLLTLVGWGADILAAPCNTAHYFIDRFLGDLPKPFIHIVEETVAAAELLSPRGAWLLATRGTMDSGLYQKWGEKRGYPFFIPSEEVQQKVQESIELVKAGRKNDGGKLLRTVVEKLWEEEDLPICAACTELPLAYDASGLPAEKTVSSLGALCDSCIKALYS